jgi:hypothetical protein
MFSYSEGPDEQVVLLYVSRQFGQGVGADGDAVQSPLSAHLETFRGADHQCV